MTATEVRKRPVTPRPGPGGASGRDDMAPRPGVAGSGRGSSGGNSLSKVARGGSLNVVAAAFAAAAGVAVVATITNGFDPDVAGTFFATTALFVIATSVLQFGAEVGMVRYLPSHSAQGRVDDVRMTLLVALVPVGLLSVAGAVAVFLAAPALAPHVAGPEHADLVQQQVRVLSCFLPVAALYRVVLAATRGLRTMKPTAFVESLGRSGLEVGAAAGVQAAGLGAVALAIAWSSSYVVALAVSVAWLAALLRQFTRRQAALSERGTSDRQRAVTAQPGRRKTSPAKPKAPTAAARAKSSSARGRTSTASRGKAARTATTTSTTASSGRGTTQRGTAIRQTARAFWLFTFPRAIATISQIIVKRLDIVLVAALRSPAEAAVYTAATRFIVLGQLGVQAIQQTLSPHLSALFSEGRTDEARHLYQASTTWVILLAWPVYATCAVLAPWMLHFFGDGYTSGAAVVVIVAIGMLMATASGSVDAVLLMSGRSWLSLSNSLVAVAVSVGLNLALIPRFGILGAAAAFTAAIAVRNLLPLVQVRLFLGMSPVSRGSLVAAVASLGCFALAPGVAVLAHGSLAVVLPTLAAGAAAYLGLVWRARRVLGLDAFRAALRPGRRRRGDAAGLRGPDADGGGGAGA